jgi:HTH-type transcriptional repressor of NAD biosynthesis genes
MLIRRLLEQLVQLIQLIQVTQFGQFGQRQLIQLRQFGQRQKRILPNMRYEIGVVIGKFYPLHIGHQYLINTAIEYSEHLHIIICTKESEKPNPSTRLKWLNELYNRPNIIIKEIVDIYDSDDSELWAKLTKETIGFYPDVVFTSENYGHDYTMYLKCAHELVDLERIKIPISGTLIRNNPYQYWDYLDPVVRPFYTIKIVLCGAESTGKTTLSSRLASEFKIAWILEYGREYCKNIINWTKKDFENIANKQNEIENEAAKNNKVIFCDTDSNTTKVWCKRYTEEETNFNFKPDYCDNTFYIFSHVEGTELIDDGTRTDSNDEIRSWMHKELLETMTSSGRPVFILTGTYEQRYKQAKEYIIDILKYKKLNN